jgi:hypothetical protein
MAWNPAISGFYTGWQTDMMVPGLQMAPKAPKNISVTELGNPYTLLKRYVNRETYK